MKGGKRGGGYSIVCGYCGRVVGVKAEGIINVCGCLGLGSERWCQMWFLR